MLPGLEAAELPADAVEVGRILDAWGIKGWFKLLPYSADPAALFSARQWYLLPADKGPKTLPGGVKLTVREIKMHSGTVVASAQGLDDRDSADALRGARIFIARTDFPGAASDEYYWVDLIGLDVINREGLSLGQVHELLSTGPQTVLVLKQTHGTDTIERMIPFVSAYVDDVNLREKQIRVDWQPDY